jgi:hypothetical protein
MLVFLAGVGLVEIVFFFAFLGLWIWSLVDVARNPYMKTSTRSVWLLVIVLFPFLGTIVYLMFATRRATS